VDKEVSNAGERLADEQAAPPASCLASDESAKAFVRAATMRRERATRGGKAHASKVRGGCVWDGKLAGGGTFERGE
jgi:hypothetical protein